MNEVSEPNVYQMLKEAIGFFDMYSDAYGRIKANTASILTYAPVCTVNLSFACELICKAFLRLYSIEYPKQHGLTNLFNELPDDVKSFVMSRYELFYKKKSQENIKVKRLEECLLAYDNAFVSWRYYYEKETQQKGKLLVAWVDFEYIVKSLIDLARSKIVGE